MHHAVLIDDVACLDLFCVFVSCRFYELNPFVRFVLNVLSLDLGQWLPTPPLQRSAKIDEVTGQPIRNPLSSADRHYLSPWVCVLCAVRVGCDGALTVLLQAICVATYGIPWCFTLMSALNNVLTDQRDSQWVNAALLWYFIPFMFLVLLETMPPPPRHPLRM
jgi:hypothetical protein